MNRLSHRGVLIILALSLILVLLAPAAYAQDAGNDTAPRTVLDFMGRPVTIDAPPQRVVGMSASIIEMLFAIGVTPVGVTDGIDYPPAAAGLPTFGSGYQPNLEALAALEPDLIIANGQLNVPIMDKLEAIAPTLAVITLTTADIPANIRTLGQATWHETTAEYLATAYEGFYTAMAEAAAGQTQGETGPSILIIVGTLGVPNYGKSDTYFGDIASILGAQNIADGREDQGPFPGYTQLSMEYILDEDPDYIFTITRGDPTPMPESMADDPIWSALTAFENGRVLELDNRLYVESPGPRVVEAMLTLYEILYGRE
ncbi:MAG: ABC transporter substrate-binding protein [Anaerolineae bacterium]|nr:ABC transporter substrate-binding protein [Anaerolineae bacterium]